MRGRGNVTELNHKYRSVHERYLALGVDTRNIIQIYTTLDILPAMANACAKPCVKTRVRERTHTHAFVSPATTEQHCNGCSVRC